VWLTGNTISRWEAATYKPSISDLERLAQFFGVPITIFFPLTQPKSRTNAFSASRQAWKTTISKK
jgi:transcriptional regulator with XRE-family HTH domain